MALRNEASEVLNAQVASLLGLGHCRMSKFRASWDLFQYFSNF